MFLYTFCLLLIFLTACNKETEQQAVETEQEENVVENEQQDEQQEEEEKNEAEEEISPYITMEGIITLQEDSIDVDVQTNLPEGVEVRVAAYSHPYGGYIVSQSIESENVKVGENGVIQESVPFDPTFFESDQNEPVQMQLLFRPESVTALHEKRDEIRSTFGEYGEHLEGPFVIEEFMAYRDEPQYRILAEDVQPARVGQEFVIQEKTYGEPPTDQGATDVWMEAEIAEIDHRYVYVEGKTNLMEGLLLFGNIYSDEESWFGQNTFLYCSEIEKDGTFIMPVEYTSLTDEGYLEIYSIAGGNHRRGKPILDTYGEEFENIAGDVVERRYEDQTEQMIKLTIPLNPEYEDTPENVDITRDGDEVKLIMPDDILFEFGESELTSAGKSSIKEIAEWLESKEYKGMIKIYGHTDNVGGDEFNQGLSEDRANNVYNSLSSHFSDESLYEFEIEGFGKREPIATNETDEGRERNRRVEILIEVEE